ncbi:MAG: 4,5-DOPA dioxygenase extradiol [Deltaproteobacteria bacterium]|nr:4,5-DOPA dioxygenase extradiol [Deltaproteobacteria bacterium]
MSKFASVRMPSLFVGHGSPMNALDDNRWTRAFAALPKLFPRPKAILAVSAHWVTEGSRATVNDHPPTIHDFGGFPKALHDLHYPAPGSSKLVARLAETVGATPKDDWGLDHGTWTVLLHMYPDADIPVVQLSMSNQFTVKQHLETGRKLSVLRDEGVLILASGNVTHNLRDAFGRMQSSSTATPTWASAFDRAVAVGSKQPDGEQLVRLLDAPESRQAHPTSEHYLPLLYAHGASDANDAVTFPIEGFEMGSLSMRAILYSQTAP